jgi:pyridoxamine 5'-phosphate oxidase
MAVSPRAISSAYGLFRKSGNPHGQGRMTDGRERALAGSKGSAFIGAWNDTSGIDPMASDRPLAASPFTQFHNWMADAEKWEPEDPNAMAVATATPSGRPSVRTVLLKDFDDRGFVFYTNKESRKGEELAVNPRLGLLFYWKSLKRQIRIEGVAAHVTEVEANEYFESRPRNSRLGAWASPQSRPLASRTILEERLAEMEKRYPDAVPRPDYWSGYRVVPEMFEFWQEMPYRLHDRTVYRRATGGAWEQSKLFP